MSEKIVPAGNTVLVLPATPKEMTPGGIVLPDKAQSDMREGTVIAVGRGKTLDSGAIVPIEFAVGDTVIYKKYVQDKIEIDGVQHYLIDADAILARKVVDGGAA